MTYDVVVIGGGPAGLSGAVALARALRNVLVIDSGEPRNAPAAGIHNYLTRDGMTPADFATAGRAELLGFGGEVREGRVVSVSGAEPAFEVGLADGSTIGARRLLVTSGLVDELPPIPGLAERWGHTVLHCPYCHGYEVRGSRIGIIATTHWAEHAAKLWRQWTPQVTLFLNDALDAPDLDVSVVPGAVASVTDEGVHLADGTVVEYDYLVVQSRLIARADFLAGIGLETVEHPMGVGDQVPVIDPSGRTAVPGIWVAGNVADPMAQVVTSAAAGLTAGAMINMDLIEAAQASRASSR